MKGNSMVIFAVFNYSVIQFLFCFFTVDFIQFIFNPFKPIVAWIYDTFANNTGISINSQQGVF